MIRSTFPRTLSGVLCALSLSSAQAQDQSAGFATPQAALDAFVAALANPDPNEGAVLAVFGEAARDILDSGDPIENAANRAELLTLYGEGYRFQPDPEADGTLSILLGADGWPFPIPLAQTDGGWQFDIEAGRIELAAREIGLNELDVIDILHSYVTIQAEYRLVDHDGDGVMEFASTILSSGDGKRDGLFWQGLDSPMGSRVARASFGGYNDGNTDFEPEPLHGYYFQILDAQGPDAPGGAMEYLINGFQVAGHALLAVPADYGESGLHTFMVAENGVVLQADLGEETLSIAAQIERYNPGDDWEPAD